MSSTNSMPTKIPVIFCIDVEPDPFLVNRYNPEPWLGFEGTQRYLTKMRARIEEATEAPAHYTWCFRMDPQVAESYGSPTWAVDRYPGFIKKVLHCGDELGTHPHAYRWSKDQQSWVEDLGNQDWVNYCVEMAMDAHIKAFGRPCETFRFGNFWMNTTTINFLEKLGIRYELTVEPGMPPHDPSRRGKGPSTGSFPDFCRVPRMPYTPCVEDFCQRATKGSRTIQIIPLTSSSLQLGGNLLARWRRLRANGWCHRLQNTPLAMWKNWKAPNTFDRMLDRAISEQAHPYLAFAIRSCIGIGRSFDSVDDSLRALLRHPERKRFIFSTPAETLAIRKDQNLGFLHPQGLSFRDCLDPDRSGALN